MRLQRVGRCNFSGYSLELRVFSLERWNQNKTFIISPKMNTLD